MDVAFFLSLFSLALVKATPLVFGAMSGLLCERSGVVNIGIEGMMLIGAFAAFLGSALFNQATGGVFPPVVCLIVGLLVAMAAAALTAALHAVLSIYYKIDQVISGTVINLLAVGITNYVANAYIDPTHLSSVGVFPPVAIPFLSDLPLVGKTLFTQQPLVFGMLILVVVVQYALFHTPWGLQTRAVGEHPRAADTVGVNVLRLRYMNVILGGVLAGMGGAFLVLENVGRFQKLITTGRGFIALAVLIFGKWTSTGALGAALLFGFSEALGVRLQFGDVNHLQALVLVLALGSLGLGLFWTVLRLARRSPRPWAVIGLAWAVGLALLATTYLASFPKFSIPIEFLGLLPYVLTLFVLAGLVGRATPPAAVGQTYEKQ